jgi:hypothetical protein
MADCSQTYGEYRMHFISGFVDKKALTTILDGTILKNLMKEDLEVLMDERFRLHIQEMNQISCTAATEADKWEAKAKTETDVHEIDID